MAKDGPSSTRIGFGFQQAREAGAPHRSEKSASQMNLENLLKRRPGLSGRVKALKEEGKRADTILKTLREDEALDGRYSIVCSRDEERENWAKTEYDDDREKLIAEVEFGIGQGFYKRAFLYVFDYEAEDWSEERRWPAGEE